MDQGGGLEREARLHIRQARRGELPQFLVDEREQLGPGLRVAPLDGVQNVDDGGHNAQHMPAENEPRPETPTVRHPRYRTFTIDACWNYSGDSALENRLFSVGGFHDRIRLLLERHDAFR